MGIQGHYPSGYCLAFPIFVVGSLVGDQIFSEVWIWCKWSVIHFECSTWLKCSLTQWNDHRNISESSIRGLTQLITKSFRVTMEWSGIEIEAIQGLIGCDGFGWSRRINTIIWWRSCNNVKYIGQQICTSIENQGWEISIWLVVIIRYHWEMGWVSKEMDVFGKYLLQLGHKKTIIKWISIIWHLWSTNKEDSETS